jgi:hypothetical protein
MKEKIFGSICLVIIALVFLYLFNIVSFNTVLISDVYSKETNGSFVPYNGANQDVNLGNNNLTIEQGKLTLGIEGTGGKGLEVHGTPFAGVYFPKMFFNTTSAGFGAGYNPVVNGLGGVALGVNIGSGTEVIAQGTGNIAIGGMAMGSSGGFAIGAGSFSGTAGAQYGGALGYQANASAEYCYAVGYRSLCTGANSVAIGRESSANNQDSVSIGRGTSISGISIGNANTISGATAGTVAPIAIGASARTFSNNGISLGFSATTGNSTVTGQNNIAIGGRVSSLGIRTITLGSGLGISDIVVNDINNSFLIAYNLGTQKNLLHAELDKGVRVGATSGESINMTGEELFVKGNTEIGGYLVVGDNTESGLSKGDINASVIYYDVLQAKSPIFLCSNNHCKVIIPERQEEYWVTKDKNFNILNVQSERGSSLPSEVTEKFLRLKQEKQTETERINCESQSKFHHFRNNVCILDQKAQCEENKYSFWNGKECLENPFLKCEQSEDKSFNFETRSCEFDAKKDCLNKELFWDERNSSCEDLDSPILPVEIRKNICLQERGNMWENNECIKLTDYLKT